MSHVIPHIRLKLPSEQRRTACFILSRGVMVESFREIRTPITNLEPLPSYCELLGRLLRLAITVPEYSTVRLIATPPPHPPFTTTTLQVIKSSKERRKHTTRRDCSSSLHASSPSRASIETTWAPPGGHDFSVMHPAGL